MGLSKLIEYLDRLGASIDEKIRFTYESQVDAGITRLTWITVALAVITIVQGVVSRWF